MECSQNPVFLSYSPEVCFLFQTPHKLAGVKKPGNEWCRFNMWELWDANYLSKVSDLQQPWLKHSDRSRACLKPAMPASIMFPTLPLICSATPWTLFQAGKLLFHSTHDQWCFLLSVYTLYFWTIAIQLIRSVSIRSKHQLEALQSHVIIRPLASSKSYGMQKHSNFEVMITRCREHAESHMTKGWVVIGWVAG